MAMWKPIRFIPTYMGNAGSVNRRSTDPAVHPHVHGERQDTHIAYRLSSGSSPRTWGTLRASSPERESNRFIPTYMGNAVVRHHEPRQPVVHPHVHGERLALLVVVLRSDGSSPRTWGTLP